MKKHRHSWGKYWKVKIDGHYERLCHTCHQIDILFKRKGVRKADRLPTSSK